MKNNILYMLIVIQIILFECTESNRFSEIKIGMTYDEVEEILGKPKSLNRGANELQFDLNAFPYEIIKRIDWDTTEILHNPKRWILKNQINTVGSLIYVTWIYDEKIKLDTFYVVLNTFKEIIDTIRSSTPRYFIGKRQVSKSEYESWDNKPTSDGHKPKASGLDKRIDYQKSVRVDIKEIKTGQEKLYYEVQYKYCIIFDSSSGRVTQSGFFPFQISDLKEIVNKVNSDKTT